MSEPDLALRRRVGERIRALRAGRGLTQLRLAERSGISRPSVANVEAGRQNLSLRQLCALAAALEVGVEDLVAGGTDGDCRRTAKSQATWRGLERSLDDSR